MPVTHLLQASHWGTQGSTVLRMGMGVMPASPSPQPTVMRATSSMRSGWRRVQQGGWASACAAALSMAWASSSAKWRRGAAQVSRVPGGEVLGCLWPHLSGAEVLLSGMGGRIWALKDPI